MTDLITWLRSALDEQEAWARAASRAYRFADEGSRPPEGGVHWRWVAGDNWETVTADPALDEFVAPAGHNCWLATVEEWPVTHHFESGKSHTRMMPATYSDSIVEMDAAAGGHIIRNDPAHVLRTVAAHREILDRHQPRPYEDGGDPPDHDECSVCIREISFWMHEAYHERYPCPDVRALARVYRDTPGFDPEWIKERS
jgi:hypothetical protein